MAGTQATLVVQRPNAHWPKTGLRIASGVLGLVDALLKWLPRFRSKYLLPGWLLRGDRLSVQQGIGVALVLAALPIILLPTGRRGRTAAATGGGPGPPSGPLFKAEMLTEGAR